MVGKNLAPVIIKRKKVIASGGHHGGAWKVAYADFVTAMMAFFMLSQFALFVLRRFYAGADDLRTRREGSRPPKLGRTLTIWITYHIN